tara:strand:- start:702 stop:920 length:219 start_codon:yes stop_codon:yes gene_type:complete
MEKRTTIFIPEALDTVPASQFFADFHAKHPSFATEANRIRARYQELVLEYPDLTVLEPEIETEIVVAPISGP